MIVLWFPTFSGEPNRDGREGRARGLVPATTGDGEVEE
jgi:hypothetical protein